MKFGLNGKLAIVTGGAGGIGSVVARMLLGDGARVAIVDVGEERIAQTVNDLAQYGKVNGYELNLDRKSVV